MKRDATPATSSHNLSGLCHRCLDIFLLEHLVVSRRDWMLYCPRCEWEMNEERQSA